VGILVLEKAKRFTGRNDNLFIATMLGLKHFILLA